MRISEDGLTLEKITNDDIDGNGQLKVAIPNSVTSIGNCAFTGCTSLTNITIPNSVISISDGVFYGCTSLTNITIPNSVISIGDYAFYGCTSLTNITIPNSVTSIVYSAFNDCRSLTNITIPNSVTSIVYGAFNNCKSLTNIVIASEDDEVIARITALLPVELQAKIVTKAAYVRAEAIQYKALAKLESTALSPELPSALPKDLHLLIAGYAGSEHVTDQIKQAMQALPIPVNDDAEAWIAYSDSVNAIIEAQQQQREAEFTTAHPIIAFAINHPYATSAIAGLLAALAVVAIISTLGVAPALAAATGLSATAATYTAAATVGVIACTATFFVIPSSLSAHIASQNKADEQDELGANVAPAAI